MNHYIRCTKLKSGQDCLLCKQFLRVVAEHALYLCPHRVEGPKIPCPVPMCDVMRASAALHKKISNWNIAFSFFFVVLLGEEHINSAICLTDSPIFNVLRYYNAKLNKDYTSNNNFVIRFQISPFWVIKFLPIQFHHKLKVLDEKFWLSQINSNFIMKCPSVYRI